jgi:GrpB-like predicted nucleotidyltransferase (UPF0157 family)
MAPRVEEIVKHYVYQPERAERVSERRVPYNLKIVEPNPTWPQRFESLKASIVAALGDTAISVNHVGSTSVPGLAAKDDIDIDLTVADAANEASYIPKLEALGYHFLIREPTWHQHRVLCLYEPVATLHVWSPDSAEAERHRIFREWLLKCPEDLELYAKVKREVVEVSSKAGETIMMYNQRKQQTIREILERALRDLGYIQ